MKTEPLTVSLQTATMGTGRERRVPSPGLQQRATRGKFNHRPRVRDRDHIEHRETGMKIRALTGVGARWLLKPGLRAWMEAAFLLRSVSHGVALRRIAKNLSKPAAAQKLWRALCRGKGSFSKPAAARSYGVALCSGKRNFSKAVAGLDLGRCHVARKWRLGGENDCFKAPDQPLAAAYRRLPPVAAAYFWMCFFVTADVLADCHQGELYPQMDMPGDRGWGSATGAGRRRALERSPLGGGGKGKYFLDVFGVKLPSLDLSLQFRNACQSSLVTARLRFYCIASSARPADSVRCNDLFHVMPIDVPVSTAEGQQSLDFTNVLRDCLSCAVITIDGEMKVTGLNAKAEQLMNLRAGQVAGKSMELLPSPVQAAVRDAFAGKPINDLQIVLRDESRGDMTIQINATLTRNPNGGNSGAVIVLNDVSSARKWESNMKRLDRFHSMGTLSASMAHEVKNAFVAVKTFVDLLLEQNKQADLAEIVRQEMGRIDSILGQMRKFSGPAKPAFSRVQVHAVLDKSLQLIQHLLQEKKIEVTRSFRASSDLLVGDQDQLEQAFINLFFNALDAMEPRGILKVSTEVLAGDSQMAGGDGTMLRVVIQDDGIGILPANMDRLFEPFFTTKPDGTGLGLAITRRIVQEHHGVIAVQSEQGKGTSFSLTFPSGEGGR
ncbi:MAG: hypothetical protein JWR26_133 [Pedosphaera sp.]|nr:hypothetical protein [Pedosphaera sp.]